MTDEIETAALDDLILPPIPGPLPATFFTDIPPGSAAVFSTEFGTRPFRSLPNPVPVHAIRSGSEDDIRDKSCDLFARYLPIAETIVTPPTYWQELYHYFDAADLWTEGAGFLFHVLGYIVKVNITKIRFLQDFAREWSFGNEARLANMVPRQDMISSLQTPDDLAVFGGNTLTLNEKKILNLVIRWHCEVYQANRISAPDVSMSEPGQPAQNAQRLVQVTNVVRSAQTCRESQNTHSHMDYNVPIQIMVETQRAPYGMAADPYQHFGRLGTPSHYTLNFVPSRSSAIELSIEPDQRISPRLANKSFQGRAVRWDSNGSQLRPISKQPYRNGNTNQSHGGQRGSFHENSYQTAHENSYQTALINDTKTIKIHHTPLNNYHQVANNRGQTAPVGLQLRPVQRQNSFSKDPVYVLNPHTTLGGVSDEVVSAERSTSIRTSPLYPAQGPQVPDSLRRDSLGRQEHINSTITVSNDARFHHNGQLDPVNIASRSIAGEHFRHQTHRMSWPEVDFKKVRTVFVTGFPMEASAGQHLEKLFSQCGEITYVRVVEEKFCAFITFQDPGSALAAISQFDGYWTDSRKSLTVRYSKGTQRKGSSSNADARQVTLGGSMRGWARELSSAMNGCDGRGFIHITPPRKNFHKLSKPSYALPPNPFDTSRDGAIVNQTSISPEEAKRLGIGKSDILSMPKYAVPNSLYKEPPLASSHHHGNHAQGTMRTPEKRSTRLEHKSADHGKDNTEHSSQGGGNRSIKSESARTQRKTPKKTKKYPSLRKNSSPGTSYDELHNIISKTSVVLSHANESSPTRPLKATIMDKNTNIPSSRILSVVAQSKAIDEVSRKNISADEDILRCVENSSHCGTDCIQDHTSLASSCTESDSIKSAALNSYCLSSQSSTACEESIKDNLSYKSVPATVSDVPIVLEDGIIEAAFETKGLEGGAEPVARQKKKKQKHRKKSSNQSNKASELVVVNNTPPHRPEDLTGKKTLDGFKLVTRSHAKTDSSTTTSSITSAQSVSMKTESTISPDQRVDRKKADPRYDAASASTVTASSRGQFHQSKKSIHSDAMLTDDVFRDIRPAQLKSTRDLEEISEENKGTRSSAICEQSKHDYSPKKAGPKGYEVNRTPTREPLSKNRNKRSDQKCSVPNRKENKKSSLSPIEILSDPSNWPALGSTKLPIGIKSGSLHKSHSGVKPLGERAPPSVPIRRDSMASVVSQPIHIAMCPT